MGRLRAAVSDAGGAVVLGATALWLAWTAAGLVAPGWCRIGTLPVAALYVHGWLTILDGGWTVLRRVTWLLMWLGWFSTMVLGFVAYVLPWGQIEFWLANLLSQMPLVGQALAEWVPRHPLRAVLPGGVTLLMTTTLAADVAVATTIRLRGRRAWRVAAFLAAAAVLAVPLWLATPRPVPPVSSAPGTLLTPASVVPAWYVLPWYAMLRGPADKLLGVALVAAAVLLPAGTPLMRTERFRSGAAGTAWFLLSLALLADFAGLGWLGAQRPEGAVVVAAWTLTAGWFAFFLLAPPLLGRAGRGGLHLAGP